METEKMITVDEAAAQFGITREGIYYHVRKGRLNTYKKLGSKKAYVKLSDLETLAQFQPSAAVEHREHNDIEAEGTYYPEPDELADLLEVVARSQRDGPGARISINQAIEAIKRQNAEFLATRKQGQQNQISA